VPMDHGPGRQRSALIRHVLAGRSHNRVRQALGPEAVADADGSPATTSHARECGARRWVVLGATGVRAGPAAVSRWLVVQALLSVRFAGRGTRRSVDEAGLSVGRPPGVGRTGLQRGSR